MSSSPFATQDTHPYQNEPTWSKSEKTIARAAFDAALKRELQDVMQKTKQMANRTQEPAEVWELEDHLSERRKEIDRKYDYRYPVLAGAQVWFTRGAGVELRKIG
jgi:Photoprotection regulator fluorescence recovery protein